MPVILYNRKLDCKHLSFQLITFVILSGAFCANSIEWGASAFAGGLACWLPNIVFMLLTRLQKAKEEDEPVRIAWYFALGAGLKVVTTIAVLVIALGVFKAAFTPLGLTYLAVLIVQIVAPAVIKR
ncbi:F0F1 ATP synthase subunit I [Moellerella wisconsensis]|uniref:ATP synthase subunit I n=3 Tax=Moellerella wisconsensis TaxID=158849 RepID=A0A0N1KI72_9GAMM|nr:F0F1 ATP synthase subunit I [Moellerella wisconsensis]KLN98045.1 ATP synthase F0F1 subunit I [Moellerella wisconsensis]KPD04034.1 ATP synthase subunit I [Moellerella wisconsensis ATCC 35017]UNH24236.1 F0F1 ATP synthase subunit I [Moellerella wisconsensis]UNH27330.1 F0F1 ATP synthase subunit I [Moellerella wisconsensis]UNH30785.1 F0F1 ATP synthase subunit I [Moellerella wisconsensis]